MPPQCTCPTKHMVYYVQRCACCTVYAFWPTLSVLCIVPFVLYSVARVCFRHATASCSAHALAQTCPTMLCIHLISCCFNWGKCEQAPPSVVAGQSTFSMSLASAKSTYICAGQTKHMYKPVTIISHLPSVLLPPWWWRHEPWTAHLFDGTVTCIVAWLTVPVLKSLSDVKNDGESASSVRNILV